MTLAEALDIVVGRTGHGRYRELCSDGNPDVYGREATRRLVIRMAGGPEPDPAAGVQRLAPLADSIRAAKVGFRACLYSDSRGCGCTGTKCHHLGRVVQLGDCLECLR